ncbi:TolC family protein [Pedobacter duraquae]|uniref:Outer membrane protein TolC n=1 Tax=Pedobacter duraquae TaxID=425511 RepID=A0A4R6IFH1_9SPHI|nr:TolC family protein [Pedobacter duraquae]TDO19655.1 outer membrane protein TolC [Pedobacter duraquae]
MNQITKSIRLTSLILLGLLLSNLTWAQQRLTLKEAVTYAVQNSVNVRKAKLDIDGGRYKTEEIRGQALPQITGNGSLTYNPIIGQLVVGDMSFQLGRNWNASAGVQLSQQLFNQTVFTGLKAAKTSESYYNLSANLTEEQVIEQVANAYYQVLVNRQQLNVIDTNIKNVKIIQKIISNQYQNGLAKKIDVDRIKVNLTNLETQREQTINGVNQLENQLKFYMGMPVATEIVLPATELTEVQSSEIFPDSLNMKGRTEMQLLDIQRELLVLQRKAYLSEYYPNLSLTGNYSYTGQSDKFDLFKSKNSTAFWYDASAIGITLKVPIFNGFITRSKVRQANVDILKADEDRRQTSNSLNLAYENAKIQIRNSINTINSQRQNVTLAQEIYKSTQNNYNNGLAALTDLLDTENALTDAQNSYTQALLNYRIAEIQLIKSNGNIKSLLK